MAFSARDTEHASDVSEKSTPLTSAHIRLFGVWVLGDHRCRVIRRFLGRRGSRPIRILDLGCGSFSVNIFHTYFRDCVYWGVDRNSVRADAEITGHHPLDRFDALDLDTQTIEHIPDASFDVVCASHVLEHLREPVEVVHQAARKLRSGGIIYLEYPSRQSLTLPSMPGTLNFFDDPTHRTPPDTPAIVSELESNGCIVLRSGPRFAFRRALASLPIGLAAIVLTGSPYGPAFYDAFHFADFVVGRKKGIAVKSNPARL